jgi:signal peptidase I
MRFLKKHGRRLVKLTRKHLAGKGFMGRSIRSIENEDHREKLVRRSDRIAEFLAPKQPTVTVEDLDYNVSKLEKALIVSGAWKPKSFWRELVEAFAFAIVVAFVVRSFIAEPFKIPSGSMMPTLLVDDYIFVTKFTYGFRIPFTETHVLDFNHPSRGEVVVFNFPVKSDPDNYGKNFIKRVVGIPGDRVSLIHKELHINGEKVRTEVLEEDMPGHCRPCSALDSTDCAKAKCVQRLEHLGNYDYIVQACAPVPENFGCGDKYWPEIDAYAARPQESGEGEAEKKYLVSHLRGARSGFKVAICDELVLPDDSGDPLARFDDELRNAACDGHPEFPVLWRLIRDGKIRYEIQVPEGHYMVMGDNRDNSHDSRKWGFVPFGAMKGRAWMIWWANDKSRIFDSIHSDKSGGDAAHAAQ